MADKKPVRSAETISLDELIAVSTKSALRTFREIDEKKRIFNPRIWVGIWIDPYNDPFRKADLPVPTPQPRE